MNDAQNKVRGRPRKGAAARDAGRRALIEAAFAILSEGGAPALTARGVAERAGTAVGSVYTAFESLEALRLEANALTMALLSERLTAAVAASRGDSTEARLLALADAYLAFAAERPTIWTALFERRTLPAPPAIAASIAGLFAILEEVLRDAPGLAPDRVPVIARALWSSVHGMVYLAEVGGLGPIGREAVPDMIQALVQTAVRGLSVPA